MAALGVFVGGTGPHLQVGNARVKGREGDPEGAWSEEGQSVLEFLLMLPMMLGLTIILVRVNTIIQSGIVNQQYARAQALFLAFNSPVYPELRLQKQNLIDKQMNQIVMGVADNTAPEDQSADYIPKATVQNIARKKNGGGSNENKLEPEASVGRSLVRVRDTVTLCTQSAVMDVGGKKKPILDLAGKNGVFVAAGANILAENMTGFFLCGTPMQYK